MLNIGKAIYGLLSADSQISDIVGNKIYPNAAPDMFNNDNDVVDYPLIIYTRRDIRPTYAKSRDCATTISEEVHVMIECYSINYNEAVDLAVHCRRVLERYNGTVNGVYIGDVHLEEAFEMYDDPFVQILVFKFRNN